MNSAMYLSWLIAMCSISAEDFHLLHHSKAADAQWEVGSAAQSVLAPCEQYLQVSSINSGLLSPPAISYFTWALLMPFPCPPSSVGLTCRFKIILANILDQSVLVCQVTQC